MDGKKELKKYAKQMIFVVLILLSLSLVTLFSVAGGAFWIKQALNVVVAGTLVFFIFKLLSFFMSSFFY